MKAYSLHAINDLRYEDVTEPVLKCEWCLVRVMACGICSSDIPRIFTKGTYNFPTIPGHEFSGTVAKVCSEKNKKLIGRRVAIFPLIPCHNCRQCEERHYEMCEHYDYIGSRRDGAFAEFVAVPVWNLIELPDSISFETAAMLEPVSVALHAVKQSRIKNGQTAAIIGTGMIAFSAAQWLKIAGASPVFVIGRNEQKRKIAEKIGGLEYISSYDTENPPQFDAVIEAVGTISSVIRSIQMTKAGGSLVLMGNPAEDIRLPQNIYWQILRKQLHVTGTWNSAYERDSECDWSSAARALADGRIQADLLITHKFSQEKLKEGLEIMRTGREPYCKVMTIWNRSASNA